MRSPAWALCWQVWGQHRRGLAVCAAVWLALAVLARVLPLAEQYGRQYEGWFSPPAVILVVTLGLLGSAAVLVYLIYALSFTADTHFEARETGFPARLFTLPVSSVALAGWPMLQTGAAAVAVWLVWAAGVLWPVGLRPPLAWPGILGAVVLAWLQALCWAPFPMRYLRLPVTAVVLTPLIMVPAFGLAYGLSPALLAGLLAPLALPAYAVAIAGVARARRGETPEWAWPARVAAAVVALLPRRKSGFGSPVEAQAWFEWRQYGFGLPYVTGLVLALSVPGFPAAARNLEGLAKLGVSPEVAALVQALSPAGVLLAGLLALVPSLGTLMGTELGAFSVKGGGPGTRLLGCSPFLAVRPLTGGQLVAAKLRMAARSTLVAWALVGVAALPWLALTGGYRQLAAAPFWDDYAPAVKLAAATVVVAALVALTWLQLVGGMWVKLTGRPWVGIAVAVAWLALLSAAAVAGAWLFRQPEHRAALWAVLPWAAGALVALKFLLAGWLSRAELRRGLVRPRTLAGAGAAWLAASAAYTGLLHGLAGVALPTSAAVVLLLVLPLNRLLAAPLALEWNRHR